MDIVFSFSLYGNEGRYVEPLMNMDVQGVRDRFEGHCEFRIACNVDVQAKTIEKLKALGYVVDCWDFKEKKIGGMFARYLPIFEDDERAVLVRDTDCTLSLQETDLIKEWLSSSSVFHIIRGHPLHIYPVMGGLFGIRGDAKRLFKQEFYKQPKLASKWEYNADQVFLSKYVYPLVKSRSLVHTVRIAYAGENYRSYVSISGFVGQTMLHDDKRESEKSMMSRKRGVLVLPAVFSLFSIRRPFNRMISFFSCL